MDDLNHVPIRINFKGTWEVRGSTHINELHNGRGQSKKVQGHVRSTNLLVTEIQQLVKLDATI